MTARTPSRHAGRGVLESTDLVGQARLIIGEVCDATAYSSMLRAWRVSAGSPFKLSIGSSA